MYEEADQHSFSPVCSPMIGPAGSGNGHGEIRQEHSPHHSNIEELLVFIIGMRLIEGAMGELLNGAMRGSLRGASQQPGHRAMAMGSMIARNICQGEGDGARRGAGETGDTGGRAGYGLVARGACITYNMVHGV